jgi:hypothetical protein
VLLQARAGGREEVGHTAHHFRCWQLKECEPVEVKGYDKEREAHADAPPGHTQAMAPAQSCWQGMCQHGATHMIQETMRVMEAWAGSSTVATSPPEAATTTAGTKGNSHTAVMVLGDRVCLVNITPASTHAQGCSSLSVAAALHAAALTRHAKDNDSCQHYVNPPQGPHKAHSPVARVRADQ